MLAAGVPGRRVFLSHHGDDTAVARRIASLLLRHFVGTVVADVELLGPGAVFDPDHERASHRSPVLIVLVTPGILDGRRAGAEADGVADDVTDTPGGGGVAQRRADVGERRTVEQVRDDAVDPGRGTVRAHIRTALAGAVPVIPVLLDDTAVPPRDALPAGIAELADRPTVTVRRALLDADAYDVVGAIARHAPLLTAGNYTTDELRAMLERRLSWARRVAGNVRKVAVVLAELLTDTDVLTLAPGRNDGRRSSMGYLIVTPDGVGLVETSDRYRTSRLTRVPFDDLQGVRLDARRALGVRRVGDFQLAAYDRAYRFTDVPLDRARTIHAIIGRQVAQR